MEKNFITDLAESAVDGVLKASLTFRQSGPLKPLVNQFWKIKTKHMKIKDENNMLHFFTNPLKDPKRQRDARFLPMLVQEKSPKRQINIRFLGKDK